MSLEEQKEQRRGLKSWRERGQEGERKKNKREDKRD